MTIKCDAIVSVNCCQYNVHGLYFGRFKVVRYIITASLSPDAPARRTCQVRAHTKAASRLSKNSDLPFGLASYYRNVMHTYRVGKWCSLYLIGIAPENVDVVLHPSADTCKIDAGGDISPTGMPNYHLD